MHRSLSYKKSNYLSYWYIYISFVLAKSVVCRSFSAQVTIGVAQTE